jgi:hypothetical protein
LFPGSQLTIRWKNGLGGDLQMGKTFNIQHPTSNIQHPTFNIQHSTSNIQHPTFNIQHSTSNIQHPTFNAEGAILAG